MNISVPTEQIKTCGVRSGVCAYEQDENFVDNWTDGHLAGWYERVRGLSAFTGSPL